MSQVKAAVDPLFSVSSDDAVHGKLRAHLARSLRFQVNHVAGYAAFQSELMPWTGSVVDLSTGDVVSSFKVPGPAKQGLYKPSRDQWRAAAHSALNSRTTSRS